MQQALPVPLILLTATLPSWIVREFEKALNIARPTYIHGSTSRSNCSYMVAMCQDERMNERVREIVDEMKKDLGVNERMVVFCRSVKRYEKLIGL